MSSNNVSIADSKKFFDSLDVPLEEPVAAAGSESDTVTPETDDTGLSLEAALAILRLKQNPILQEILQGLQSQIDGLESKAKDLKNLNPQRCFDRAEGLRTALASFASNFEDALARLRNASNDERLKLAGSDAELFAKIVGKSANVQVARPGTVVKTRQQPDYTREAIAAMEGK